MGLVGCIRYFRIDNRIFNLNYPDSLGKGKCDKLIP